MPEWAVKVMATQKAAGGPWSLASAPAGSSSLAWRAQGSDDSLPLHCTRQPLTSPQSDAFFHKIQQIQPPGNWPRVICLVPKDLIKHCLPWEPGPSWSFFTLPCSS